MGYKYSFVDNQTYGVDDINGAISRLTTSGITIYPTDENLIAAMNEVVSNVASQGVEFEQDSCLVYIEGENIKINHGTAFFDDGVSIVIDSEGETLPLEYGVYVYLFRDINRNTCYPAASAEFPQNNYVLLAQIDNEGNVIDKREYAYSKLAPNSPARPTIYNVDITYATDRNAENVRMSLDVGYSHYKYLIFQKSSYNLFGFCELSENEYSEYFPFYEGTYIRFKKDGGNLKAYVKSLNSHETINGIEIILF